MGIDRLSRRAIAGIILFTALLAPLAAAPAASKTNGAKTTAHPQALAIRAAIHDGYARLVFAASGHETTVPITAAIATGRLTVRFARPVAFATAGLDDRLQPLLTDVHLAADGLTLTGRVVRPVEPRMDQEDPQTLVLDLVAATPAPASATPRQAPRLPVTVKVGEHPTYDRLVMSWPASVAADLTQGDGHATVSFGRPARINEARVNAAMPTALQPFHLAADGRSADFTLPPGWHARLNREGRKLIVDAIIGKPSSPSPLPSPPAPTRVAGPTPPVKAIRPLPAPPALPPPGPIPQAVPVTPVQTTALAPQLKPPTPAAAAAITAGLVAAAVDDERAGLDLDNSQADSNIGGSFGSSSGLRLIWSLSGDGLTLRFEWPQPVSAAVFRRGGGVWIVFDQEATLDLSRFESQNLPVVTAIDQVPVTGGTALHLAVWAGFNPSVTRAGNTWIVDLKNGPTQPDAPTQPRLQDGAGASGTSLVFPVLDPAQPLTLQDADAADTLIVVPLPELGQGVENQLAIPDLRVLATNQGIAIQPISEALTVRSDEQDVAVSAPGGLLVSTETDRTAVRKTGNLKREALIDFPAWTGKTETGDDFFKTRQMLERAIMDADQPSKTSARIDLAKFDIANGLGAEALGVLAMIEREDPQAFDDPQLRAIRAVASDLMNRPADTLADLSDKVFNDAPDAILWRAAAAADQQNWNDAVAGYDLAARRLGTYPPLIRRRLDLKFAESLLDARPNLQGQDLIDRLADYRAQADALLDDVIGSNPTEGESDTAKVLRGRILGVDGDVAKAKELWTEVSNSPLSSLARAEAGYALILSSYEAGTTSRYDTIQALDRMRYDWRGDDFEVRLMRKIGELSYDNNDYHTALDAFRDILTNFPTSPYVPEIAAEMQRDFTSVFVGPRADSVPPIVALGVFEEFKILTPPGAIGDAVARNLIDRLVSIDLLDRASGALYQEVTTRLTGVEQARGTTELALLELLQGKPDEADKALSIPVDPNAISPSLAAQRQEFSASAAFMRGDNKRAFALLQGDTSLDADRLRADIYWANHDWKSVASLLVARLPPPSADLVFDDQTAGLAMNAATAMSLSNDQTGLANLRQNYGTAMANTSLKDDFATLVGSGVPDPATLANFGAQVAGSRSFIETYRQRVSAGKLSTVLGG